MTKEQDALLKKAESSLKAAEILFAEGLFDFSASRAYYAMFYVAEALLLGEGLAFSKHSAVIAAFGKTFVKAGRIPAEFHRYMIEAEDGRNVGDYDIGPGLSGDAARQHIDRAQRLLLLVRDLLQGSDARVLSQN